MAKIKLASFEDACKIAGDNPTDSKFVTGSTYCIALEKLVVCVKAANMLQEDGSVGKEWQPNWNNGSELKWQPIFEVKASKNKPQGSGLVFGRADGWRAVTYVPSHLCFRDEETLKTICAKPKIRKLYEDYMLQK